MIRALALAGAMGAASALASEPRPRAESMPTEPGDLRAVAAFAGCVAERETEEADRVLALDYRTPAYRAGLDALARKGAACGSRGARGLNDTLFAGGLAEKLLGWRFGNMDAAALARPERPIATRTPSEAMALCVVRAAPGPVRGLFATRPGSDGEDKALAALAAPLAGCVPPKKALRLSRPLVRAVLATTTYRLALNTPAATPAAVN